MPDDSPATAGTSPACRSINNAAFISIPFRCGSVRCGSVRCNSVRCGSVRCGSVRCSSVRCAEAVSIVATRNAGEHLINPEIAHKMRIHAKLRILVDRHRVFNRTGVGIGPEMRPETAARTPPAPPDEPFRGIGERPVGCAGNRGCRPASPCADRDGGGFHD